MLDCCTQFHYQNERFDISIANVSKIFSKFSESSDFSLMKNNVTPCNVDFSKNLEKVYKYRNELDQTFPWNYHKMLLEYSHLVFH